VRQYLNASRTLNYSLFLTAPLLMVYELGIHLLFRDAYYEVRNTGDVMIRNALVLLQLNNRWIISGLLVLTFAGTMAYGYRREKHASLRSIYFPWMLIEGALWGLILFLILALLAALPLMVGSLSERLAQYNLALGAGIYEELVFRAILIPVLITIGYHAFGFSRTVSTLLALAGAALIFASFHLLMETFNPLIFLQRAAGGVLLGTLYLQRGYGIAVYSHVSFNLITLLQAGV